MNTGCMFRRSWPVMAAALLAACAQSPVPPTETLGAIEAPPERVANREIAVPVAADRPPGGETAAETAPAVARGPVLKLGSGEYLNSDAAAPTYWQRTGTGDISLNFIDAELRDVIRVVLGDILKRNYVIDPAVRGKASLQTSRPLPSSQMLPVLESVLQIHGAALVDNAGTISVVPLANAVSMSISRTLYRQR